MRSADLAGADWFKSTWSTSNGECVEVAVLDGARWFKSSRSNPDGECVEVAVVPGPRVAVRDTKDHGAGPAILFGSAAWSGFVGSLGRTAPPGE